MPIVNVKQENVNVDSVENNLAARVDEGDTRKMCIRQNIMRIFFPPRQKFFMEKSCFFSLKERGFFLEEEVVNFLMNGSDVRCVENTLAVSCICECIKL